MQTVGFAGVQGVPMDRTIAQVMPWHHVRCKTMLSHWVVIVLNVNVPCHLQQCKCPDQDLWAPLYVNMIYMIYIQCMRCSTLTFKFDNLQTHAASQCSKAA